MTLRRTLTALALPLALSLFATASKAGSRALISLHEADQTTWEKRVTLQESLRRRFGFDETRFLVNATPKEVPAAVKRFLEEPADEDDHRLVWVSGLDRHHDRSICPDATFDPIEPRATSLILAPACYGDALLMPQGTRHFSLGTPDAKDTTARIGRVRTVDAPWIAHLSLPADGARFVEGVDAVIAGHLSQGPGDNLDAAGLLHLLRARFRWNGSNYTPSLDLFDRGIEPDELHPFAFDARRKRSWLGRHGRKVDVRGSELPFYDQPSVKRGPDLNLYKRDTVRVLRHGRDEAMRFVTVDARYFGWVRKNDLKF